MPRRRDIDHFLLHFRLERDDDTASAELKRRSGVIVTAFEAALTNGQTSLDFLIARMNAVVGAGKPDADLIRGLAQDLRLTDKANSPVDLLSALEDL